MLEIGKLGLYVVVDILQGHFSRRSSGLYSKLNHRHVRVGWFFVRIFFFPIFSLLFLWLILDFDLVGHDGGAVHAHLGRRQVQRAGGDALSLQDIGPIFQLKTFAFFLILIGYVEHVTGCRDHVAVVSLLDKDWSRFDHDHILLQDIGQIRSKSPRHPEQQTNKVDNEIFVV